MAMPAPQGAQVCGRKNDNRFLLQHSQVLDQFANRGGVRGIVLSAQAIRRDELVRHQSVAEAEALELTRPVVSARAGFQADRARRKFG